MFQLADKATLATGAAQVAALGRVTPPMTVLPWLSTVGLGAVLLAT